MNQTVRDRTGIVLKAETFRYFLCSGLSHDYLLRCHPSQDPWLKETRIPSIEEFSSLPLDCIPKLDAAGEHKINAVFRKAKSRNGRLKASTFFRATETDLIEEHGEQVLDKFDFIGSGDGSRFDLFLCLKALAMSTDDLSFIFHFMYNFSSEFLFPLPVKSPSEGSLTRKEWTDFYYRLVTRKGSRLGEFFGKTIQHVPERFLLAKELRIFEIGSLLSFVRLEDLFRSNNRAVDLGKDIPMPYPGCELFKDFGNQCSS